MKKKVYPPASKASREVANILNPMVMYCTVAPRREVTKGPLKCKLFTEGHCQNPIWIFLTNYDIMRKGIKTVDFDSYSHVLKKGII